MQKALTNHPANLNEIKNPDQQAGYLHPAKVIARR
jgi:hypothetical protein